MSQLTKLAAQLQLPLVHLIAAGLALVYAWLISGTHFVTSGVQFVSPLAVVLLVHLAWLTMRRGLTTGFATAAVGRSLTTALGIVLSTAFCAIYAPIPLAAASSAGVAQGFGVVVMLVGCLAVLALVIVASALVVYGIVRGLAYLYRMIKGPPEGPGASRLFDVSVASLAFLAIGAASLEGVRPAMTFGTYEGASVTMPVAASPARVWQAIGKATSPTFPLPAMLRTMPQPVAVLVDEGADLGARRVVHFKGREGEGDLVLKVVRRTESEAVFAAVSDASPIAMWVSQRSLTFRVESAGAESRLTVASAYDRLLSPAWFFRPYIRVAAYLAVDVLARDTKERAEAHQRENGS